MFNIVFWIGSDGALGILFSYLLYFFPYSGLSPSFCFFGLFHFCCFHVLVFGKTLVHDEDHIFYIHTEWYLHFSDSATTISQCIFGAKSKNT